MEDIGDPPASKIKFLRSEGWTYQDIAEYYGLTVAQAYSLAHEDEWRSQPVAPL